MFRVFLIIIAVLGSHLPSVAAEPLKIAKQLAEQRFDDWTYGSDATDKQIDCVQFVLAVVEECLHVTLADRVRERILVSDLTEEERTQEHLERLILADDARICGVQTALVSIDKGHSVSVDDTQPGDLIQYWMKRRDGSWFGHAGIIESVDRTTDPPTARVYGAHRSQNGIGTSSFDLRLIQQAAGRRIYLVRLSE